jgi:hypothetical protein
MFSLNFSKNKRKRDCAPPENLNRSEFTMYEDSFQLANKEPARSKSAYLVPIDSELGIALTGNRFGK